MKKILPKLERSGAIYFITFTTWERLELNLSARKIVLDSCLFFAQKKYQIYTVVIMPDHVHLLIQPFDKFQNQSDRNNNINDINNRSASILLASEPKQLSKSEKLSSSEYWSIGNILHSIKSYSAKQIPTVMNHIGKVWQDGRYDRMIRERKEFQNTWEYIRQNPVKAGLSNTPEEYPYFWEMY
jgi:REP element-mobilizing transposase RayT